MRSDNIASIGIMDSGGVIYCINTSGIIDGLMGSDSGCIVLGAA